MPALQLMRRYRRWRHGRGFGVHSPFAYSFIRLTLRERLPYYAYHSLDPAARADGSLPPRTVRMLMRIAVGLRPACALICGGRAAGIERRALRSADSRIPLTIVSASDPSDTSDLSDGAPSLVIVNDGGCAPAPAELPRECTVVYPDLRQGGAEHLAALWAAVPRAMRFDNLSGCSIVVIRPTLPKQLIEAKF